MEYRSKTQVDQPTLYLDFEQTAEQGATPAVLGVLFPDGQTRQYIVDEELWAAAVAQKTCVPGSLEDAVADLVSEAESLDATVCGWSRFDLLTIERSPAISDRLKTTVRDRYLNGRPVVKVWSRNVYDFRPTEDAHDPAAALKKYVAHFAWPWPAHLRRPQPARWIRHLRQQLASQDGRYRRVTSQAKRDWHKLLDYNRADLHALRALVDRARVETRKWEAYRRATYRVLVDGRTIAFKAGPTNARRDALVRAHNARTWAHITAWNPGTSVLPETENRARHSRLAADAREAGLVVLPGDRKPDDGAWPPGDSAFIIGISEGKAVSLAREYGQWAIVVGERGGRSRLVWCRQAKEWTG